MRSGSWLLFLSSGTSPLPGNLLGESMERLLVLVKPITPIIAPKVSPDRLRLYVEQGWIDKNIAKHLDRAFYRTHEGKPVILTITVRGAVRAIAPEWANKFTIQEGGIVFPRCYVETRSILRRDKQVLETFEAIDASCGPGKATFLIEGNDEKFMNVLRRALMERGLGAHRKCGFGRCDVVKQT